MYVSSEYSEANDNYYELLGLKRRMSSGIYDANLSDIKNAYRSACDFCYEKNLNDAAFADEISKINQAYLTLSDQTRRMEYDYHHFISFDDYKSFGSYSIAHGATYQFFCDDDYKKEQEEDFIYWIKSFHMGAINRIHFNRAITDTMRKEYKEKTDVLFNLIIQKEQENLESRFGQK